MERARSPGLLAGEVAQRPAEPAEHDEQERAPRVGTAASRSHDRQAGHGDRDPDALAPGQPLVQEQGPQDDGEGGAGLQHERGQAGREAGGHAEVEADELQRPEAEPVADQPAHRHLRARHEQDGRDGHDEEPQGGGEQGREDLERLVDRGEVDAPQDGDEDGEEHVAEGHGTSLRAHDVKVQRVFVTSTCRPPTLSGVEVRHLELLRDLSVRGTLAAVAAATIAPRRPSPSSCAAPSARSASRSSSPTPAACA